MTTSVIALQIPSVLTRPTSATRIAVQGWVAPAGWNFRQRHPLLVEIVFIIALVLLLAVNG